MTLDDIPFLQEAVDALDARVVELVRERLALSRQIGAIKRDYAQAPLDPARIGSRRTRFLGLCRDAGFSQSLAEGLFSLIAAEVAAERRSTFAGQTGP